MGWVRHGTNIESGDVTCSLRPECLRIHANGALPAEHANHFPARVRGTVYLGDMAQHTVEMKGGLRLKSYEINPRMALEEDQPVTVEFDPEDLVILAD